METPPPHADSLQTLTPTSQDWPALAEFLTISHPDTPVSGDDVQANETGRLDTETLMRQVWTDTDGHWLALGDLQTPRSDAHEGWLELRLRTRPDQSALAPRVLNWLLTQAAAQQTRTLLSRVQDNWWEHAFLEAQGFREHDRMWMSTLDLRGVPLADFAAEEDRVRAAGLRVRPLADLGPLDEAQQRRLYTLMTGLLADVPTTAPIVIWPFEVWQRRIVDRIDPAGLWVALTESGEWVGVNELYAPDKTRPGTVRNGLTGVRREWRGTGAVYALKLAGIRGALERGFTHARTGNHAINRPMLRVNERLGFVRDGAASLVLRRDLETPATGGPVQSSQSV